MKTELYKCDKCGALMCNPWVTLTVYKHEPENDTKTYHLCKECYPQFESELSMTRPVQPTQSIYDKLIERYEMMQDIYERKTM